MSLRLILESGPGTQARREMRLAEGSLSIGRGADCDWQIDDPQMFVSRRHCVIMAQGGQFSVTDESRGGLFLDQAMQPLGQGVTATLMPGMRLRMGDFVIRVEVEAAAAPAPPPAASSMFGDDFFTPRPEAPAPPRPASLPDPFDDAPPRAAFAAPEAASAPPPMFDDPFSIDVPARPAAAVDLTPAAPRPDFDFGDFGLPREVVRPAAPPPAPPAMPEAPPPPAAPVVPAPPPQPAPQAAAQPASLPEAELLAHLLRGMGIAPPPGFQGSPAEIEALGRRFRLLAEGLVQLLRARAREKGSARVAQTVIGASDVNPLKFLVTTEDALTALIAARGPGYLDPDTAITAAFRDLHDHQRRTWSGLQSALRRMIDRFDPAAFESEIEDVGLLKSLVAGGRPARLWQLYADRYRDIARAAEDRFLGEVGADFRNAYENERSLDDDGKT